MQQHLEPSYLKVDTRAYKTAFQRGLVKGKISILPFLPLSLPPSREPEMVSKAPQEPGKSPTTEPHISCPYLFSNLYTFPDTSQTLLFLSNMCSLKWASVYFSTASGKPRVLVTGLWALPANSSASEAQHCGQTMSVAGRQTLYRVANWPCIHYYNL